MTNQHPITPPPELVEQWYDACILEGAITYDEYKFAIPLPPNGAPTKSWRRVVSGWSATITIRR
jgi:hypothetical protein